MSEFEEMNGRAMPLGKRKKKKGMIMVGLFAIVFTVFLLLTLITGDESWNWLLLFSGAFEFLIGIILYKVSMHQERYICPDCGNKREHHREHLSTEDKITDTTTSEKITYTHYYEDTYICPNCGCERTERLKKSGGYIEYFKDSGLTRDYRKSPKEF